MLKHALIEFKIVFSWEVVGGAANVLCGIVDELNALVMFETGKRQVCTDYMDVTAAGNLRFVFGIGQPWNYLLRPPCPLRCC